MHPNKAVTKQSQLCFVLSISHILHAGSFTVISKQQNVRENRGERVWLSGRHGLLQLTLYYFKSNVQIARFGGDYPLFIVLSWRDGHWRWCQERCLRFRSRFKFQPAPSLDAANVLEAWLEPHQTVRNSRIPAINH